jgi:hypothetical protein
MPASPLVSWQTLPAADSSTNYAVVAGCTTEVHNTHKTGFREVRYRWHPWHGQGVVVRGESRRGNMVVLQCVREEVQECRTLEIPEWMFDAGRLCSDEVKRAPACRLRRPVSVEAPVVGSNPID